MPFAGATGSVGQLMSLSGDLGFRGFMLNLLHALCWFLLCTAPGGSVYEKRFSASRKPLCKLRQANGFN